MNKRQQLSPSKQQKFPAKISRLVTDLSELWQRYSIDENFPQEIEEQLNHSLTKVENSSVELGYSKIYQLAHKSKTMLEIVFSQDGVPTKDEINLFAASIKNIQKAVLPINNNSIFSSNNTNINLQNNELIYLISEDNYCLEKLNVEILDAGFDIQVFSKFDDLNHACQIQMPTIIVSEVQFSQNDVSAAQEIERLIKKFSGTTLPIIFMSEKDDLLTRLTAIRSGGSHFLTKPLQSNAIINALTQISNTNNQSKLRVFLVDDDTEMLTYLTTVLDKTKLEIQSQHEPLEVLSDITEFKPEVLVLDNYMPECSGFELAKIIRQNPRFNNLPIVFLSSEKQHNQQIHAMDIGVDDFIIKPIDPEYFNRLIFARANRARQFNNRELIRKTKIRESEFLQIAINEHSIVSAADFSGHITYVNDKFCEISGYSIQELLGRTHTLVNSGVHTKEFFQEMWGQISCGKSWHGEICNRSKNGELYWVKSSIIPFMGDDDLPYQYVSVRTDITAIKAAEVLARESKLLITRQQALLDAIRVGIVEFVDSAQTKNVAETLLPNILDLTDSECGFIGAIHYYKDQPFMMTQAISTTKWKNEDHKSYDLNNVGGPVFSEINDLMNITIHQGEMVISNDPINDSRIVDANKNTPDTPKSYIGIPIVYADKMVGMFGLANRPEGYDKEVIDFLLPFTLTYGVIIHAQEMAIKEIEQRDAIIRSREGAESANRAKSLFLSNMSHELRTPLNAILGFAQLLSMKDEKYPLNETQTESISEICIAGKHLLSLISDILDLSKIETGVVNLDIENFSIDEVFQECKAMLSPLAIEKNLTIQFDYRDITLHTDHQRLKQIIINLISNAIKYNTEGGNVNVTAEIVPEGMVRIGVKDTGIGIPLSRQDKVFTSFQRLGAEKTNIQGAGIGLAIAKSMTEYLNGTLSFESEEGLGTQFWIDIPTKLTLTQSNVEVELISDTAQSNKKTIVIIDSDMDQVEAFNDLLISDENALLIHVPTVEESYLVLTQHDTIDFILIDIDANPKESLEFCSILSQNSSTENTIIIALGTQQSTEKQTEILATGCHTYLCKPINDDLLLNVIYQTTHIKQ